jgi:hypothetical protein
MNRKLQIENRLRKYIKDQDTSCLTVLLSALTLLHTYANAFNDEEGTEKLTAFLKQCHPNSLEECYTLLAALLELSNHLFGETYDET